MAHDEIVGPGQLGHAVQLFRLIVQAPFPDPSGPFRVYRKFGGQTVGVLLPRLTGRIKPVKKNCRPVGLCGRRRSYEVRHNRDGCYS
jgi:hypothetical protein